jgi:hypothetical protein
VPAATPLAAADLMSPTYQLFHPPSGHPLISALGAPAGLNPPQVRGAYGFDQFLYPGNAAANGTGETIAIVDAYDDPTAVSDLTAFDQQFGLADPTFTKVGINALGSASTTTFPSANADWSIEIALDIEWAHAIAPKANILLVEANSNSYADLLKAVDYARNSPGVATVSMSWGGGEISSETSFDSHFTTPAGHPGVTFFASTGDSGAPALAPSVSSHVVAVGGTSLNIDSAGDWLGESAWSDGGGGISKYITQPSYQNNLAIFGGTANGKRATPDVAYDADPMTGVAVLSTYGYGGWLQVGGTSAAAPQWAALVAIADQGRALAGEPALDGYTQTLPDLYHLPSTDFHDVMAGDNGFPAGPGYDLATGRGSPIANQVIPDLIGIPRQLTRVAVTPANVTVGDGKQLRFSAIALDQYGQAMDTQPVFTWSLINGLGSIGSDGLYSAPAAGNGVDTVTATVTVNNVTFSGSALAAFQPGPSIAQLGASPSTVTGFSTTMSAQVTDLNPGTLAYSWWVVQTPAGAMTPTIESSASISTSVMFYQAGGYEFAFRAIDSAGVSDSGLVSVTVVPTYSSIAVVPATTTLAYGWQKQFAATADDQFGNPLASQPAFTWSLLSGTGTIDAQGLYTAPGSGNGSDTIGVTGTSNGITESGSAVVTYVPGFEIASINASPGLVTGTTTTVSAIAAVPGDGNVSYFWSVWSSPDRSGALFDDPGSRTTTATFFAPGHYELMVTAYDVNGSSASATVDVDVVSTVSTVRVTPLVADVQLGGQQQFAAEALDQFFEPMPATFSWSIAKGSGSVDGTGLYTAPSAGSGSVYVQAATTVDGVIVSGQAYPILLQPLAITSISASPNPVTSGTLTASADDPNGGSVTYSWSVVAAPAGAKLPALSAANSWTTGATFFQAGTYAFQVTVTSTEGLTAIGTVGVTVNPVLTSVTMTPAMATVADQIAQQFTANAFDQFHQPMPVAFAWSMVSGPGSIDSGTGLYTPPTTGTGTAVVEARATANGVTLTGTAAVALQAPPKIALISAGHAIVTGTITSLKVVASNPNGGKLTYLWSVVTVPAGAPLPTIKNAGAASTTATFFEAGSYTFQVMVKNQKGSTTIGIVNVSVTSVTTSVAITPATAMVPAGNQRHFVIAALDQFHNEVVPQSINWSMSGLGSIDASGLYQAPISGSGAAVVRATIRINGQQFTRTASFNVV